MEKLFQKSYQKLHQVPTQFKRYLAEKIDWNSRLIGIKGARGAGKTTLLLQYAKEHLPQDNQTLYVSLDDLFFTENNLVDFAEQFVIQGGKYLLLDEVHRYQNWSQELKNIYDDQPDLKIIFTGSSLVHLNQAKGDLSRRAVMYELYGLSYREFLNFTQGTTFEPIDFKALIDSHTRYALEIADSIRPLAHFRKFLEHGYYPYFKEAPTLYPQKLSETISLALNIDLPSSYDISFGSVENIRLLLHIISESAPFKPNISKLSERIGISRNSLVHFIRYLEDIRVIKCLYANTKGIGALQKPEKIYMHHPNLQYALADENPNIGNVRESFFINQLGILGPIKYTSKGDFAFADYVFEIGGRGKTNKQVKHLENAFVAADEIEIGHLHKIPLWLFGFLY
ncbi:ATP-binding protein [Anaerophaga thermohalophila]|uniref:ATP-binding protein n=1 Tax=Anaerophaga thermohalophila TaxID=177400 RepID=UPI000237C229|nr:AAA family ATPase [Anaerophaga thermohalophila]